MRSHAVASLLGLTYRQIDFLARTTGCVEAHGSGSRREWGADTVLRLAVAAALARQLPGAVTTPGRSVLPEVAALAFQMPTPPPRSGYACLTPNPWALTWVSTWADVRRTLDTHGAAVVIRYDLADLLGPAYDTLLAEAAAGRRTPPVLTR